MKNTTLILDSSVIAKWFFPEKESEKALEIKEEFVNNRISLVIPLLLYYEFNNLLKTTTKMFRIDPKAAAKAYNAFLKLNFVSYSSELLLEKTLEVSLKFDISSYDASYVALSEYLQVPFLTADKKLLGKVSSKFIFDFKKFDV